MHENAVRFRQHWPADAGRPFDIGIGINSGSMAVGILDARRHIEPTVIGDTVNLASRVESLTKQYRSEEHTSELQSRGHLVCRLLLEKKKKQLKHVVSIKRPRKTPRNSTKDKQPKLNLRRLRNS